MIYHDISICNELFIMRQHTNPMHLLVEKGKNAIGLDRKRALEQPVTSSKKHAKFSGDVPVGASEFTIARSIKSC
jgi:hypothetical protein